MSLLYKTPNYFSDFHCLGGDCEDICCRNWEVRLDKKHFDLLRDKMYLDNNELFEKSIHINQHSISHERDYAFISMKKNGYCTMLDDVGLCSIQSIYGMDYLGDVCSMFPRVISRCVDTFELSGSLSCPEVVRKCIDDSFPLKSTKFKPSVLPRNKNYPIQRESSNLQGDFYSENFELVREYIMKTMADEDKELNTRLYIVASFSDRISSFYHRGCDDSVKDQFESVSKQFTESEFLLKLDTFIKNYNTDTSLGMIVVHSILSIKSQKATGENISKLYEKIIHKHMNEKLDIAELLSQKLIKIRIDAKSDINQYVDKAVTRYILNCLYREWFTSMPDLFTYTQMLLVRTTILRALIYLDIGDDSDISLAQLKQKIVYIMYNFARNIDQNLEFLKVVYNALSEQSMINFDFSPAFIRIY